jgi:hypothetical protein
MKTLEDVHTCIHCQDIELDGTGRPGLGGLLVTPSFRFNYSDVSASATICPLFRWCLRPAIRERLDLNTTHRVSMYVNTDSEDITYLYVRWEDASGQALATDDCDDDTPLHVFSHEGTSCLLILVKLD